MKLLTQLSDLVIQRSQILRSLDGAQGTFFASAPPSERRRRFLVINATYGGNDPERRKSQITRKMLIESGIVLFKIDLELGELSYFEIRDGRLMLELKNGRYTTIHMAPEKVHLIPNVPNEFFKVIDDMLTRIDNNRETYHESKKAKDRRVYGVPVNP